MMKKKRYQVRLTLLCVDPLASHDELEPPERDDDEDVSWLDEVSWLEPEDCCCCEPARPTDERPASRERCIV